MRYGISLNSFLLNNGIVALAAYRLNADTSLGAHLYRSHLALRHRHLYVHTGYVDKTINLLSSHNIHATLCRALRYNTRKRRHKRRALQLDACQTL